MKKFGIIGLAICICLLTGCKNHNEGVSYIKEQESLDTKELSKHLTDKRIEEKLTMVKDGTLDVFSMFEDYVIYGDSRVYGFASYGYLPWNRVFADAGNTILNISDYSEALKEINPSNIYFSYGVNDMGLDLKTENGTYGDLYEEKVKGVLEICPNANIFINSIVCPTPAAVEEHSQWGKTDDFNHQIQEMCQRNGWNYVDISNITNHGEDEYYQEDGVHYIQDLYPVWAERMIDETIKVVE